MEDSYSLILLSILFAHFPTTVRTSVVYQNNSKFVNVCTRILSIHCDKYQLSKYHSKHKKIANDEERLTELVPHLISDFKLAIVDEELKHDINGFGYLFQSPGRSFIRTGAAGDVCLLYTSELTQPASLARIVSPTLMLWKTSTAVLTPSRSMPRA